MKEPFLQTPRVVTAPGEAYADATRRFQGIPGIARTRSGQLWACWYGGGVGEDSNNHVLLARSADDGDTWSPVCLVVDPEGDGPTRAFDPCLRLDPSGQLRLFWAQGYEHHTDGRAGVWTIVSPDPESTDPEWSEPARLADGIMMNKPIVTRSGEWLLPVARWQSPCSAGVVSSLDKGRSWNQVGCAGVPVKEDRSCDENQLVELKDGSLLMWVRTTYGIGESRSGDNGRTWTPVVPSGISHPVSRFNIRRLPSGKLLLVKHGPWNEKTGRSHLTAYLSADDGVSWSGGLLLDSREGVSYPDSECSPDGTIHVIYDFERRDAREILLARFNEGDVETGAVGPGGALRVIVNKAGARE